MFLAMELGKTRIGEELVTTVFCLQNDGEPSAIDEYVKERREFEERSHEHK